MDLTMEKKMTTGVISYRGYTGVVDSSEDHLPPTPPHPQNIKRMMGHVFSGCSYGKCRGLQRNGRTMKPSLLFLV